MGRKRSKKELRAIHAKDKYPQRSKHKINYHSRSGYPKIHMSDDGRKYIMVRAEDGKGTRRLYEGSKYQPSKDSPETKKLDL